MRWKSRAVAFVICFVIGFLVAAIVAALWSRFGNKRQEVSATPTPCATADYFNSPEEVLAALKDPEVSVRRNMRSRLLLRPDTSTVYYDYERDFNFPERADRAQLRYDQLDDSLDQEALLTFVRFEHPVALIFKKKSCGWQLVGALSSWLRFEDYPYENWLTLREAIEPGIRQLLVRESHADALYYTRKARLLRLKGDALVQVAEFDEETIRPLKRPNETNWSNVKYRTRSEFVFAPVSANEGAHIEQSTEREFIEFEGPAPQYSYWLESDGSWHARKSHWNRRPASQLEKPWYTGTIYWWNAQEGRFR